MERRGNRLSRRAFVGGVGALGLPLLVGCEPLPREARSPARAPIPPASGPPAPARMPRVGWLNAHDGVYDAAFRAGLLEHGYVEAQNIVVEWRRGETADQLAAVATELAQLNVDVIVVAGGGQAARGATCTIPIVVALGDDPVGPVGDGLAARPFQPCANATGLNDNPTPTNATRLQLLKAAVPTITRVGVVWHRPTTPVAGWGDLPSAAQGLGVELQSLEVREPDDLDSLVQVVTGERIDALLFLGGRFQSRYSARLADFAGRSRVPSMAVYRAPVVAGGLMAYGANLEALVRRAAYYVDHLLKGVKPRDLPIEQPMTFDFVVNMKTAQALGITFPNEILLQVTEVIQ